jgi:hypothetical protein
MHRTDAAQPIMGRSLATLGWALCMCGTISCALDWSFSESELDGGPGDAADAYAPDTGELGQDAADGATADGAPGSDGAPADAKRDAGSGCHSNAECGPSAFCHYPDHQCGLGAAGSCLPRPSISSCPGSPYACTCDGTVEVTGPCGAESNGNDVSTRGCGSPPPGNVCGYVYCISPCVQGTSGGETTFDCQ